MTLRVTTEGGVTIELLSFDGKFFVLISPTAYAPGQPLPVTVELTPSCSLDLKSIGSKARPDGRFDVRARANTLPRPTRERILAALAGG